MAKLMPGRVRNEGIELFEKDLITIHQVSETQLDTTVDQHHLIYALNDSEITCDCDYFAQKGYCPHLAAVEYYLKNDKEGQRLLAELEEEQESSQGQERGHSFGGLFLEGLSLNEDDTVRYSLMVEGEESTFGSEIWEMDFDLLKSNNNLREMMMNSLKRDISKNEKRVVLEDISVEISDYNLGTMGKTRMKKRVQLTLKMLIKETNRPLFFQNSFFVGPISY